MHARTPRSKDALIPLINEAYEQIRAIELPQGLTAGRGDTRPRIELFHDAIRAYSSGQSPYESTGRLTIERLAWDIEMLRALQANPMQPMPGAEKPMTGKAVVLHDPRAGGDLRMVKSELSSLYKKYAVFFVAILAETADMNHKSQMEDLDTQMEDITHRGGPKMKQAQGQIDATQAKLEKQHLTWLSGQLAMYEESKDVVQQLLRAGLNMAGKFLQESIAQGGRGAGGRGF